MNKSRRVRAEQGQGLVEYALLLVIIFGMGRVISGELPRLLKKIGDPLKGDFVRAYKYGHPKACGFDNDPPPCSGSPEKHPRYVLPGSSRMFARGKQ